MRLIVTIARTEAGPATIRLICGHEFTVAAILARSYELTNDRNGPVLCVQCPGSDPAQEVTDAEPR
jgi:hypothetical protein